MNEEISKALNRIADAGFQQAKATRQWARAAEAGVELQKEMLEIHKAQASVTAQLERSLTNAAGRRDS